MPQSGVCEGAEVQIGGRSSGRLPDDRSARGMMAAQSVWEAEPARGSARESDGVMSRMSLPVKIGLGFAAAGLLLTIVGIVRGQVPLAPLNIAIALLIGGGVWFVVAWAVASAAVDVERDVEEERG